MSKYRKKPVVVRAYQFFAGQDHNNWPKWLWEAWKKPHNQAGAFFHSSALSSKEVKFFIYTLEGVHEVSEGDYIIQGIGGELYPCKSIIFGLTYEPVEGE